MSSPELNDSERSNFQSGAKVSDDETLKKYSKQNDDFSDEQAKSIFDNNDDYQTRDRYYRQDVIRNPWFWMYMSRRSYHRYGNSYHSKVNNNAYTKGYQDGFADAEKASIIMIHIQRNQLFLVSSQQLQRKQPISVATKMVMMMANKADS